MMTTCAFASAANDAAWPESMLTGGGIPENVGHGPRAAFPVPSDTWRALLQRKTLHAPVYNVFRPGLAAQLPLELGPAVDDRHQLVFFLGRQGEGDAIDADLLAEFQLIEHLGHAEDGYRQVGGIAACLLGHDAELVDDHADAAFLQPVGARDPAVAVADGAARCVREGPADDDRRMRLLERLGPLLHLVEGYELPVILGLLLGPDRLHRLHALARELVAALEDGAVVLDLVLVPAVADAEQEAALGELVDGRHDLGGDDGIALGEQGDARPDLQLRRHRGRGVQHQERIHDVVVRPDQRTACRVGRFA